ncbi:hypothetical protein CDL12_27695 [Handroanthus impetiginosus]|uniref:Uncharacterized protein n=1 Tax=Handroanthus impetiginosus TaxID=429701 RepID=A0A2G9G3C7_9LAMI|nr:hypothetical protein CDL12_27695 [Handroanthus impetiginosus]
MVRSGIKNAKMWLMKPFSTQGLGVGRCMSKLATPSPRKDTKVPAEEERRQPEWMPHPRTGIYFPAGTQEWVMEDVPRNAALLDCTFWLRSIDGVDDHKPDPDIPMQRYPN